MRDADVVVVGAGIAGLVAAREIVRAGSDAVVVEARDRVGGRTLNHRIDDETIVELGGQWIGPTQDRVEALVADLGLECFRTFTDGEIAYRVGESRGRAAGFPDLPDAVFTELAGAIGGLEAMAATLDVDAHWRTEDAKDWDAQTLRTYIEANSKEADARALLELITGAIFTASSDELSLLHVLFYIRSAGSLSPLLTDVVGGAQERRVVGGTQRICELIAEELGDRIVLASPVRSITQDEGSVTVRADRVDVRGRRCIVAVPPAVCDRIAFEPALPGARAQLQRRMAAGSVVKCNAIYDTPFWRDQGMSGQLLDTDGPITAGFDNSPPDGSIGILMGFLEADHARRFAVASQDERRAAVLESFTMHFGAEAAKPIDYVDKVWDDEEWTRGCYGSNLPPGTWTRYGPALREPIGRLHWASAETATRWMNYMDGAVRSGERAAHEVLDRT